jgi:peptidoglycan/LPS O-acetylase OafA/YrhL
MFHDGKQGSSWTSKNDGYITALDGLRAVAVLSVIYTHYYSYDYWLFGVYWGNFGVRLFFVISGF